MLNRGTRIAIFVSTLLLAVLVLRSVGQGESQGPDKSIDGLVGEKAVLFLREFPVVERREIVQLHGRVGAVVARRDGASTVRG